MIWSLQACSGPAANSSPLDSSSDPRPNGRYSVEIIEITDEHYDGSDVELQLEGGGVLVWDSPVSDEDLTGVFVRVRIGSASGNFAFAPIRSWLRSEGETPAIEIGSQQRVRIADPGKLLLGQHVGVAVPHEDYRSTRLVTHEIGITIDDYAEVYQPSFTNSVIVDGPRVYIGGYGNAGQEYFHGTYVGAWVIGEANEPDHTPAEDWLLSESNCGEGNLYGIEVGYHLRFRDRAKSLIGRRVLIASVPE